MVAQKPGGDRWWDGFWRQNAQRVPDEDGETWYDVVWSTALRRWLERANALGIGRRVLECGCGTARFASYFQRHGYDVTMLDYSAEAIGLARAGFADRDQAGQFVRGDMTRLGLRSELFDIVYSGGVLDFIGDLDAAVSEMARVLKPGGLLAASVVPRKLSIQSIADLQRSIAYAARALRRGERAGWMPPRAVPTSYPVFPWTLEDYAAACRRAGLVDVQTRVTGPFPALALPVSWQPRYARLMRRLDRFWRRFDESDAWWTKVWGAGYVIQARKPPVGGL